MEIFSVLRLYLTISELQNVFNLSLNSGNWKMSDVFSSQRIIRITVIRFMILSGLKDQDRCSRIVAVRCLHYPQCNSSSNSGCGSDVFCEQFQRSDRFFLTQNQLINFSFKLVFNWRWHDITVGWWDILGILWDTYSHIRPENTQSLKNTSTNKQTTTGKNTGSTQC